MNVEKPRYLTEIQLAEAFASLDGLVQKARGQKEDKTLEDMATVYETGMKG